MRTKRSKRLPTYHLKTFGCQMNRSDSERIVAVMTAANHKPASAERADILIVNTCSVRQSAEDRAVGQIAAAHKKSQQIVITGCLARQKSFIEKFRSQAIFVDITQIANLPLRLAGQRPKNKGSRSYFAIPPRRSSPVEAYVPIMTGCDNFCSYCIVPYVRGRERSRPKREILKEIKTLIANGYQQITLLGQNVNRYRADTVDFPALLEKVARLPGDFRVFFITSLPQDFSGKIIRLVKKYPKLCPYFHLPVQSGSDKILRQMNRHYTRKKYISLIKLVRKSLPRAAITTDLIVGFPGETKQDFEETVKLFRVAKFDLAYLARYSPRPCTASAKMTDDVSLKEKLRRGKQLESIIKKTARAQNQKQIGQACRVLVDRVSGQGGKTLNFGKNELLKTVKFIAPKNCLHQLVPVKVTAATSWGLYGHLI